jgi:hypothetical protein
MYDEQVLVNRFSLEIPLCFAAAFRNLLERCKKCVRLGGEFVEKS